MIELIKYSYSDEFYEAIIEKCNNGLRLNDTDLKYIIDWDSKMSKFHKNRLVNIKIKQFEFLDYVHRRVINLVTIYEKNCMLSDKVNNDCYIPLLSKSTSDNSILIDKKNEVNVLYNKWIEHSNTFQEDSNQKQRAERIYTWSNYFRAVATLLNSLGKTLPTIKPMYPSWSLDNLDLLSSVLTTLYNNNYFTAKINTTPFTTELSHCLKLWAQQEGVIVNIESAENISLIHHDVTQTPIVNMFLPSHRSPIPDALLMGHLDLPHYILFGNPNMFASCPDMLKNMIVNIPEFIPVGKIKDKNVSSSFEKLVKSLKAGISRNVINYAQGFVPSTGEILPISSVFVNKLLAPLIILGYQVNVYPITYEIESEFLLNKENHQGMVYTIKYGKPIMYNALKELVKIQLGSITLDKENLDGLLNGDISGDISDNSPKCVDHYLLTYWYENIVEYPELTTEQLIERANKRFDL